MKAKPITKRQPVKRSKIPTVVRMPSTNEMLTALFGEPANHLTEDDVVFVGHVIKELARARGKFPSSIHSFAALVEEVGELGKALISEGDGSVYAEAMQTAVMAIRVAVEGDSSFAVYRDMKHLKA
jgi:hypothetical protein